MQKPVKASKPCTPTQKCVASQKKEDQAQDLMKVLQEILDHEKEVDQITFVVKVRFK